MLHSETVGGTDNYKFKGIKAILKTYCCIYVKLGRHYIISSDIMVQESRILHGSDFYCCCCLKCGRITLPLNSEKIVREKKT